MNMNLKCAVDLMDSSVSASFQETLFLQNWQPIDVGSGFGLQRCTATASTWWSIWTWSGDSTGCWLNVGQERRSLPSLLFDTEYIRIQILQMFFHRQRKNPCNVQHHSSSPVVAESFREFLPFQIGPKAAKKSWLQRGRARGAGLG